MSIIEIVMYGAIILCIITGIPGFLNDLKGGATQTTGEGGAVAPQQKSNSSMILLIALAAIVVLYLHSKGYIKF